MDTLQLLKEYDLPAPMTFKEEGGVSLHPDGSKFIAVCACVFVRGVCGWCEDMSASGGKVQSVL